MKLEANTPIYKLLETAYEKVGGGQNLQTTIDSMRKEAETNPSFKAMFPYQKGFENAAKSFLSTKGVKAMTIKLEAKSRLTAAMVVAAPTAPAKGSTVTWTPSWSDVPHTGKVVSEVKYFQDKKPFVEVKTKEGVVTVPLNDLEAKPKKSGKSPWRKTTVDDFGDEAEDHVKAANALCKKFLGKPFLKCFTIDAEAPTTSAADSAALYKMYEKFPKRGKLTPGNEFFYIVVSAGGTKILLGNMDGIIFAVSPEQIDPVAKLLKTVTLEH